MARLPFLDMPSGSAVVVPLDGRAGRAAFADVRKAPAGTRAGAQGESAVYRTET